MQRSVHWPGSDRTYLPWWRLGIPIFPSSISTMNLHGWYLQFGWKTYCPCKCKLIPLLSSVYSHHFSDCKLPEGFLVLVCPPFVLKLANIY